MTSKTNFTTQVLTPILVFLILLTLIFRLTHPAISLTQDLGRHLKLGQIISFTKQVPRVNLFTYTNQNFEFINHHWLSEVIFFKLHTLFNTNSLIILKLIILSSSFLLMFYLGSKKSSIALTSLLSIIFLPIFFERTHIRPEIFSMALFSLTFLILSQSKPTFKTFLPLPLIFLLWINLHIYFAAGLTLFAFYLIHQALRKQLTKSHLILFLISCLLCLINPNGLKGLLLPLKIFTSYGYTIIENQNPFFLFSAAPSPSIWPFFISLPFALFTIFKSLKSKQYFHFLSASFFTILALKQIRNFPLYTLSLLPLATHYLHLKIRNVKINNLNIGLNLALLLALIFQTYSLSKTPLPSLGEPPNIHHAFNFIKSKSLQPPYFNNFDISGLAIYHLYPQHQLFVDNHPEAFPPEFFQETFIPAMQNPQIFSQINQIYNFNTIIISHTDITPWATAFINSITHNPNWTVVFLDNRNLILVNKKTQSEISKQFEINDQNAISKLSLLLNSDDIHTLIRLNNFFTYASWKNSLTYTNHRLNYLLNN